MSNEQVFLTRGHDPHEIRGHIVNNFEGENIVVTNTGYFVPSMSSLRFATVEVAMRYINVAHRRRGVAEEAIA